MRTQIYDRLMEPDIDAEIKNLAIELVALTKFTLMAEAVEKFKTDRVTRKEMEEKRKADMERRRKEAEEDRKNFTLNRKNELLANKTKQEKMKKRDLMLKMRAQQRKREGGAEGALGAEEKAEMRRREMEKMKED